MPNPTNHLIIFAKAPRLGRVKTRLARDIGTVPAWTFYRRCLTSIIRRMAEDSRWQTWLALTPDGAPGPRDLPENVSLLYQGGGDLGTRMNNAMVDLPPGPTIIIGTDIPDIAPANIADGFRTLGHADTVFGPAHDGGYWLVGCRRRPRFPDLFSDVRWSSEHTLNDTLKNATKQGLSTRFLDRLEDVDDIGSYSRYQKKTGRDKRALST